MRKMIKIAAAAFCVGVLLGGVGTGIAIVEYASLEYTGEHILGTENMKTENLDISVVPEEDKKILIYGNHRIADIQYDEEVPENTIRYRVTYNSELVTPRIRYDKSETERNSNQSNTDYQGETRLESLYTSGNEFDIFMRNKDNILEELKHKKIGSYRTEGISRIEIWLNPQMEEIAICY